MDSRLHSNKAWRFLRGLASALVLSAATTAALASPLLSFNFSFGGTTGTGLLDVTDIGGGKYWATGGSMTLTGGPMLGTFALGAAGPAPQFTPSLQFEVDNVIDTSASTFLDVYGLFFEGNGYEYNLLGDDGTYVLLRSDGVNKEFVAWNADEPGTGVRFAAVPEPASLALVALGLAALAARRRRR